ncbi:acyl-CoA dehydrogenase domain-containing protein [Sphingobium chlorophenolicum L-1]|uniref:Acyl-CoA dehydrogenase domain-containing protein n=1 Tax=Sphingobium chlorophenolicum L-1 TaxID=690566 RepID=F6ETZ1_SPHCR|nr:acyl-CoA dehydrogenase [Sphingobium chlorophenolicum]AEG47798.1 acyl-CoA dehydrogenase domain-containing protein [Sphingobium chlorophenolicum L-1]
MSADLDKLPSRDLLAFQLFDWLDTGSGEERETLMAMIDATQRVAAEAFLPHYRQGDIEEPRLEADGVHVLPAIHQAMALYAQMGLFGASFPEELGGLGLSCTASLAIHAGFAAANVSTAGYPMLTAANARLIAAFGTPAQVDRFARPQIEGRWFGTMCLSEPQAGSSLGDIRTRAVADGEDELGGRYRLSGNKMWISAGDQNVSENIVHLVLAKIAQQDGGLPEGSKGISLFIVPKILPDGTRNDLAVAGLNHKMGFRGTANCLLNFGEGAGAVGWRVGGEGQGLAQMFMMMNEARISVGMGAAALAYRGYRQSLRYAQERLQGRAVGVRNGAPIPIFNHPDVRRMLLQQKAYAEGALALCLYCARLVDQGGEDAETLLALLTPVAKSWPSEFGLIANDLAIQVHGGYGYTRDFDVEQLWRDNRLNPIHEGTTGIQAIDLLGRKILLSDGRPLALLRDRIGDTAGRAMETAEWAPAAAALLDYWRHVEDVVAGLRALGGAEAYDDATLFLRAFGHGVLAWLWLDQVLHARGHADSAMESGVAFACRFFFESELPQADAWLRIVGQHGDLARTMPDEAFA